MKSRKKLFCTRPQAMLCVITIVLLTLTSSAFGGAVERVIHNFLGKPDGAKPNAGLVADSAGNLYGTTTYGGTGTCADTGVPNGCGSVFELSPPTSGQSEWTETVLHSFRGGKIDGSWPNGSLILDDLGNLYGTAWGGVDVAGVVFELSPPATEGGTWTETLLYSFPSGTQQGRGPLGRLTMDGTGNLFGTTIFGGPNGPNGAGTLFELRKPAISGGRWHEITLHTFGSGFDGALPNQNLVLSRGVLYGTTQNGGDSSGTGTVFQASWVNGSWTENVILSFTHIPDGANARGGLVLDSAGNLYGTTEAGGILCPGGGCGTVFELSPPEAPGGDWQESILYRFTGGKDGAYPLAALHFDRAGNLYGTAYASGLEIAQSHQNGTVFELSPPAVAGGSWIETTVHEFGGTAYNDGSLPDGELIPSGGKLYGTTSVGGSAGLGTVFSIVTTP